MGFFPTVAVLALLVIGASCRPFGPDFDCSNFWASTYTPGYGFSCYSSASTTSTTTEIMQVTYNAVNYDYSAYEITTSGNYDSQANDCLYYYFNPTDTQQTLDNYCRQFRITCAYRSDCNGICADQQLLVFLPGTGVQPTGFDTGFYSGFLEDISERERVTACAFEYPDYDLTAEGTNDMPQSVVPEWLSQTLEPNTGNPGTGPSQPGDIGGYYEWKSQMIFSNNFMANSMVSPVEMMCSISFIDCGVTTSGAGGIVVVGNSQGASIGISAHRFFGNRIAAIVSMAGDPRAAYPAKTNEQNRQAYPFADYQAIWNSDIDGQLRRSRRVYLSGENDVDYFTFYCQVLGLSEAVCTQQANAVNGGQDNAITVQNLGHQYASGAPTCGAQTYNCIQTDGSGYYTLQGRSHEQIFDYYDSSRNLNQRYSYWAIQWATSCSQDPTTANCDNWAEDHTLSPTQDAADPPAWVGGEITNPFFNETNSSPLLVPSMALLVLSLFLIVGF